MDNKTDFRLRAKTIRKGLDMQKISLALCEKIRFCDVYKSAINVLVFYPLENEVNVLPLLGDDKQFYLPRISGENLEICPYKAGDELILSKFKTKEPVLNAVESNILDLIILPALAADKKKYRLGYGKGYYDRLLSYTNAVTVLPIAKELVFEQIPVEKHDKPCDILIQA